MEEGEVGQRSLATLANGRCGGHCWRISRNTQQAFFFLFFLLRKCKLITQGHSINVTMALNVWDKAREGGQGLLELTTAAVALPLCGTSILLSFCSH